MKLFGLLVFTAICVVVLAEEPLASSKVKRQYQYPRPQRGYYADGARRNADANAQIINQFDQRSPNGDSDFGYELSNGIKARQTTVTINGERVTTGYYSYIENGQTYTVNYVADRNGYRASGAHLPVQPLPLRPQQQIGYPGYPSSTPAPAPFAPSSYPSSTPLPFRPSSYPSSTPFPSSPYPSSYPSSTPIPFVPSYPSSTPVPIISSTPYPFNGRPSPTSIYVPSSTPFNRPGSIPSGSYLPPPSSTPFPIYQQPYSPFPGYQYQTPRPSYANNPYTPNYNNNNYNPNNNYNYQTPAPVFYSTSTPQPFPSSSSLPPITSFAAQRPSIDDYSRVSSTLAPPLIRDGPTSTVSTILDEDFSQLPPRNHYISSDFISSTPRPFNNNGVTPSYQQPDTVYITPKAYNNNNNNQRLPNSLAINQDLLPPYLNVNGLDGSDNVYRRADFQVSGPRVRPLNGNNNYNQPNDYKK